MCCRALDRRYSVPLEGTKTVTIRVSHGGVRLFGVSMVRHGSMHPVAIALLVALIALQVGCGPQDNAGTGTDATADLVEPASAVDSTAGAPPEGALPDAIGQPMEDDSAAAGQLPEADMSELPATGPDTALDDAEMDAPAFLSEDAFLATYASLEGVVLRDSGLMYRVVEAGDGTTPTAQSRVRVTYRGTLMNGQVFDETAPGKPVEFQVSSLIRGWQEALPLMREGATWDLVVPSYLAYGEKGTDDGTIGPSQPLIFEMTLLEVLSQ